MFLRLDVKDVKTCDATALVRSPIRSRAFGSRAHGAKVKLGFTLTNASLFVCKPSANGASRLAREVGRQSWEMTSRVTSLRPFGQIRTPIMAAAVKSAILWLFCPLAVFFRESDKKICP